MSSADCVGTGVDKIWSSLLHGFVGGCKLRMPGIAAGRERSLERGGVGRGPRRRSHSSRRHSLTQGNQREDVVITAYQNRHQEISPITPTTSSIASSVETTTSPTRASSSASNASNANQAKQKDDTVCGRRMRQQTTVRRAASDAESISKGSQRRAVRDSSSSRRERSSSRNRVSRATSIPRTPSKLSQSSSPPSPSLAPTDEISNLPLPDLTEISKSLSSLGLDEDDLTCPICLEVLKRPRALPCNHSFCLLCLQNYVNSCRNNFSCPSCRGPAQLPPEGVVGLPEDEQLVEGARLLKLRRKVEVITPCLDCQTTVGLDLCGHCHLNLCKVCGPNHAKQVRIEVEDLRERLAAARGTLHCRTEEDEIRFSKLEDSVSVVVEDRISSLTEEGNNLKQQIQAMRSESQMRSEKLSKDIDNVLADSIDQEAKAPKLTINLQVLEADDLKLKGYESTAVYCIINVLNQSERTASVKCSYVQGQGNFSLPQWDHTISPVSISPSETLFATIELWQKDAPSSKSVPGIKRTPRDKLIGLTCIDITVPAINNERKWYELTTPPNEGAYRVQGKICIKAIHNIEAKRLTSNSTGYRILFNQLCAHYINNKEEIEEHYFWDGKFSSQLMNILDQFSLFYSISESDKALAHWLVVSERKKVDYEYILDTLKILKPFIFLSKYSDKEEKDMKSSMKAFVDMCEAKLKELHVYFPLAPHNIDLQRASQKQLTFMLRCLIYITTELLHLEPLTNHDSSESLICSSLTLHTNSRWEDAVNDHENRNMEENIESQNEQCLLEEYEMADKCGGFLKDVKEFYSPTFLREVDISHLSISYQILSEKLAEHIMPVLDAIYKETLNKADSDWWKKRDPFCLEPGIGNSPAWKLYDTLTRIQKLCEENGETNLDSYHTWFTNGIDRWINKSFASSKSHIKETFEKEDFFNDNSLIVESLQLFDIWVKNWNKIGWPDTESGHVQRDLVVRSLIGLAKYYKQRLEKVLKRRFKDNQSDSNGFPSLQLCVTINCLEALRKKMQKILGSFKVDFDNAYNSELIKDVDECVDEIKGSKLQYIDINTTELLPKLKFIVTNCCSNKDCSPLLGDFLENGLYALHSNLYPKNFHYFLNQLWMATIKTFQKIKDKNIKGEYDVNFFENLKYVLDKTYVFFTSGGGDHSLEVQEAETKDYTSLVNSLEYINVTTTDLEERYYSLLGDQGIKCDPIATVHARGYFISSSSKLMIEVTMTNITIINDINMKNYYKVKLVPEDLFPGLGSHTTELELGTENVVYSGDPFEFELCKEDERVQKGSLLLTLMRKSKLKDTILGDAVIPLKDLPHVDLSADSSFRTEKFSVIAPQDTYESPIVKTLAERTWDPQAVKFIKQLNLIKRPSHASCVVGF